MGDFRSRHIMCSSYGNRIKSHDPGCQHQDEWDDPDCPHGTPREDDCIMCDAEEAGRKRGRAEERAAIVRYLRVWADSVRDNEAIDGRLQALVTDTHAGNIESGEHITRPDRAKGGGT